MPRSQLPHPDLTGLQRVPFSEIAEDLNALARDPDSRRIDALDGLLLGRTLRLIKEGTRAELLDEALNLARFQESEAGRLLQEKDPTTYGGWIGYCELLGEAARRSDPVFTDTLLRSTSGHGERLLSRLAATDGPVPRAELREELGISESNLSHLLRKMEAGELVFRRRKGNSIEVELGRTGRRIVEQRLRPAWLDYTVHVLEQLADGPAIAITPESVQEALVERGVPTESLARQLAVALCNLAPRTATPEREKRRPSTLWYVA